MEYKSRDTIVGLFTLASLFCFGWLVFRFGDLPGFVSKMDANQVTINFSEIPGIQENSAVYFRGYSIGKVVQVDPPTIVSGRDGTDKNEICAVVTITLPKKIDIPDNVIPKIFQRSLGSSYIELALDAPPSDTYINDGDIFFGKISSGSQFISESTQDKLDSLIVSLNQLSNSLQSQLKPVSPDIVDQNNADVQANLTTAIIRFDATLKNINDIIGDNENKGNFKSILSDLAQTSNDTRKLVAKTIDVIEQSGKTVENIDSYAKNVSDSFIPVAIKAQEVADNMSTMLKSANTVMIKAAESNGTINRLLEDPALYESLSDTAERLSLAATELQKILKLWQENGIKMKL